MKVIRWSDLAWTDIRRKAPTTDYDFFITGALLLKFAPPPGRMVDLGVGRGESSLMACDLGYEVHAMDGRGDQLPKGRPDITWTVADMRDFEIPPCRAINCCGLLYHMTREDQVPLLARCRAAAPVLLLETHVCMDAGAEGEVHHEGRSLEELKARPRAALNNLASWWPTVAALERMLLEAGYAEVLELRPWRMKDRTTWVALTGKDRR